MERDHCLFIKTTRDESKSFTSDLHLPVRLPDVTCSFDPHSAREQERPNVSSRLHWHGFLGHGRFHYSVLFILSLPGPAVTCRYKEANSGMICSLLSGCGYKQSLCLLAGLPCNCFFFLYRVLDAHVDVRTRQRSSY